MVTRKRCGFCQHEEREELERMLENGEVSCDDLDSRYNWRIVIDTGLTFR